MTTSEKLNTVKTILRIEGGDIEDDMLLSTYLDMAEKEILGWRYSNTSHIPSDVPYEYDMTQIQAVVNGFTQAGVEGQVLSIENGIHRHFQYADMVEYVRAHVIPIAGTVTT